METKNSLTTLLNDLLKLQNNGYQIITKLSEIVSSNSETVEIPIPNGNRIESVTVPSFGSIKNQINRLENNIKSISGIGDVDLTVQLSDGTFRKVLVSKLQREAEDIKSINSPTKFATKENWFFESFLNPLLYVKFDLTNQVKFNTESVEVSRYILNLDSETKVRIFDENFKDRDDIQYQNFTKILLNNDIKFFLDKEITRVEPRKLRFWGTFSVTQIFDDVETQISEDVEFQKKVLKVKLDKLLYNDSKSEFLGTSSLKVGDFLIVNNDRKNTRYKITNIQSEERIVSLELVEGFDPITIGSNTLSYYSVNDGSVSLDVNIGFNEYCVIFVKPIDPDSKVSSINWSPGVAIYTNDLTTTTPNGEELTLSQYYQNEVIDFGAFLYSMAKDGVIPSSLGLEPNPPNLLEEDFQVVQINQHLTETGVINDIKKLQSDKVRVQSNIKSLNRGIKDLRAKVQTTKYSSIQLEENDRVELSRLIEEKTSQSKLYESIIDDINKIAVDKGLENLSPKYRVRGFFPMPEPKVSERTGPQEVVQFIIQYRYLNKDGGSNQPRQLRFLDNDGQERRGTFSTWIEVPTDVRRRVEDPETGNTKWIIEDVEDGDVVNINSIDIPISPGEFIEFRIKSLSESGWPVSPKESIWSDVIRIEFPEDLESSEDITSIIEDSRSEKVRIELQNELNTLGIPTHISNSIEFGSNYFAHPSSEISSGFLTSEQSMISLFEKLKEMDSEITRLKSLIESTRGVLSVRVIDEIGVEYEVQPNTTLKLFAGNYKDEVADLQVKKGAIITKNYFIKISNNSASILELYSRFWGSRRKISQPTWVGSDVFSPSDADYNTYRKYDFVPIGLSNPEIEDIQNFGFIRNLPESSSQVHGQFIQSRYKSIDGTRNLYSKIIGDFRTPVNSRNFITNPETTTSSINIRSVEWDLNLVRQNTISSDSVVGDPSEDFIWKGSTATTSDINVIPFNDPNVLNGLDTSNPANLFGTNNSILVHVNHPDIPEWIQTANPNETAASKIRNSVFANQQAKDPGGTLQTSLWWTGDNEDPLPNNTFTKIGFEPNDQYLIGPRSVGAYLFLNPNSHDDLVVDGADALSLRRLNFGDASAISIPVTFQYRMTDYFGVGDSGIGNVGGLLNSTPSTNLTYTKTIGIDIYSNPINKEKFSFDIEVTARYFSRNVISREVPQRTFESVIDDLNSTIKTIAPRTSRDITPPRSTGDSNRT